MQHRHFGGKTIRIVKHDRIDAQGKEVGVCFVWHDVVSAVLPNHIHNLVGKTDHNVGGLACILGLTKSHNQSP